ncbi:hypothetical protein ACMXYV_08320 [Neptuniibacter sp. SY11_33]|uniref:hypothetical protein n=1 Tax=Neptuniibacter sp. SY11_33 TaxID=3398215 RepID=UPI0039F5C390
MKPPFYDQVHQIALDIVNASESNDQRSIWSSYSLLKELCEKSESAGNGHPFLWETLADFTTDSDIALNLYKKALRSAENLGLSNYSASIKLSMAENYIEAGHVELGSQLAGEVYDLAEIIDDLELRKEANDVLLQLNKNT